MKKLILSAIAATLIASPLAVSAAEAAPQRDRETTVVRQKANGRTVVTQRRVVTQPTYRNWRKGQRFEQRYARNYRQIDYRQYRGLRAPPRGYRYVRSGNDAVLIRGNNVIAQVFSGIFR
ncbi:RcnB family protein [Sphingomonas sp. Tas61C01]|uniref:RcnB family protein n=1 Tax=Sphingomonas sp. Tas61C01 TaxID=3458297 RepID=UPI00403E84B8